MQSLDPAAFLSQGKFHKSAICKRTQTRVSFGLIGDWSEGHHYYYPRSLPIEENTEENTRPIILYILPSGCSRYMGALLDGIVSAHALRMVAIDRPGVGATPLCPGVDRMKTATQQTISVIEAHGYGQSKGKVDLLTHSGGWFYALNLLTERSDLFTNSTRIAFSSPFVPTPRSGTLLSLLPKSVVELTPSASSLLQMCGKTVAWSAGIGEDLGLLGKNEKPKDDAAIAQKKIKDESIRTKSQARLATAKFHPPYEPHSSLGLEAWKTATPRNSGLHPRTGKKLKDGETLLFEYFVSEGGVRAATEDFLFCLGKVDGMDSAVLEGWAEGKLNDVANIFKPANGEVQNGLQFLVIWCEKDFMIPAKGRAYLDLLFEKTGLSMENWVMADGGHDAGIASKQVMNDILDYMVSMPLAV